MGMGPIKGLENDVGGLELERGLERVLRSLAERAGITTG